MDFVSDFGAASKTALTPPRSHTPGRSPANPRPLGSGSNP